MACRRLARYVEGFQTVATVYRKESSPVAKRPGDERKPSRVSSHRSIDLRAEVRFSVDERIDVAESVVAVLQQLRGWLVQERAHMAPQGFVERLRRRVVV